MAKASPAGVHLKFQRAREHVADLDRRLRAFLDTMPFKVYPEEDQATGDLLYRVHVYRQPPPELSLVIGDLVHNCRTALDHLAWQLVLANGGRPDDRTMFPIARSKDAFPSYAQKCLKGASKQAFSLVEQLKPYHGGDERFWRLHRLDVEDKHRLLIPVGATHQNLLVSPTLLGNEETPTATFSAVPLRPADRQYPLQDGAVVLRILKAAREADPGSIEVRYGFMFDVAFSDDTAVAGESVQPTLANLVEEIAQQVEPLIAMLQ